MAVFIYALVLSITAHGSGLMTKNKKILLPAGILILSIGLSMIFVDQYFFDSVGVESGTGVVILGLIASFLGGGLIVASWFRG